MTSASGREAATPALAWSRLRVGQYRPDAPADHDYLSAFGMFRVWRRGDRVAPLPPGLSVAAVVRRRFAEKLADAMAWGRPADRALIGADFESVSSVYAPVAASELAQRVIRDAAAVTQQVMVTAGQTRVYSLDPGVVVLVHGPDWSLVFEINAVDVRVRVCGDELGDIALAVDEDPDPKVQSQLLIMVYDVLFELQRMAIGGDLYHPGEGGSP